jgi:kynurenine formamidase
MRSRKFRTPLVGLSLAGWVVAGLVIGGGQARSTPDSQLGLPGFTRAVFLSHINNPRRTPGFPGDPAFTTSTAFTVPKDGFYLQYVKEGEHTGTHWGSPCHFHIDEVCAPQLLPQDLILPAVVVDVRQKVKQNVDYQVSVGDLKAWEKDHGPMPQNAAVIAYTGCARFWGPAKGSGVASYYNCGTGEKGFHQPGFSLESVKWLIGQGVLGDRGALGTDTFGPDPGTDAHFRESSLVFHRHRIDLENLTHVGQLPPSGAWIVVGGPRNSHGSGSPATIYGLVP